MAKKKQGKGYKGAPKATLDYKGMRKAFATPGMQDGEKEMLQRIAANRGVSMKKARVIGTRRTARGLNTAGVQGPKGPKIRHKSTDASGGRGTVGPKGTTTDGSSSTTRVRALQADGRLGGLGPYLPKPTPKKPVRTTSGGSGTSKRAM